MRVKFQRSWSRDGWEILVYEYNSNHSVQMYTVKIEKGSLVEDGGLFPENERLFVREEQFKQIKNALIEGLSDSGLLKGSSAVEAELKATNKHLEDMRSLVFNRKIGV